MGNLKDTLSKRMKQMGIERQVEAVGVVEAAQKEISKYISNEDFEVVSFNREILKIRTRNSVIASEIQQNNRKIKKSLKLKHIKIIN